VRCSARRCWPLCATRLSSKTWKKLLARGIILYRARVLHPSSIRLRAWGEDQRQFTWRGGVTAPRGRARAWPTGQGADCPAPLAATPQRSYPPRATCGTATMARFRRTDRMKRMIARAIVTGLVLVLPACANAIDIICPPAGHCPDTRACMGEAIDCCWLCRPAADCPNAPAHHGVPKKHGEPARSRPGRPAKAQQADTGRPAAT